MSSSPERMSSYRRCFEGSSANQPRLSSASPSRRETSYRSASCNRNEDMKIFRAFATKPRLTRSSSTSMSTLCLDVSAAQQTNADLDAATAVNQAFKLARTTERQEMVVLNDRLAVYIEKVRSLESKNKTLEAEIEALKSSYERTSGLRQLYASQLKELNREAEQMREQRDSSLIAKEAITSQLELLKSKYNDVLESRKQTEHKIEVLRPDVDKATSGRIKLQRQLENLEAELTFLQKVHKEETEELMQQIHSTSSKMDLTFGVPDLSYALTQIQAQYDSIAAKNLQDMDAWYREKLQELNDVSAKHAKSVQSLREEMASYRKDILNKECELDSLRSRQAYLESHIRDVKVKYKKEEDELEEHTDAVKRDLKLTKEKTALLMREYQDLLNAKMTMEIEIATYRKLIEGEDSRLSTVVGTLSLTDSLSDPKDTLKREGPRNEDEIETPETISSDDLQLQATEMSERKTVLVRTIKKDEDVLVSSTQQCTITISGAAENTEEE